MKIHIGSKPLFSLKIGLAALLISMSGGAYAEYYIGPSGSYDCYYSCCESCCGPCHYEMYFHSPHRYSDKGTGQVEEYAWIDP